MSTLKSIILYLSILSIEITKNDNWKLAAFFGFFFCIMAFLVMLEYSNIWGRLLILFFAYLAGNCLGSAAIILDRNNEED